MNEMTQKTALNRAHRESGGKMVDFAGWDMPLHYGSQKEEHHCVREDAGVFDVSHMTAIDIEGNSARAFLRRLLANDVARLHGPGRAMYSCMLNDNGGVIDDLIVYFIAEGRYRAVVNAATTAGDIAWMARQLKSDDGDTRMRYSPSKGRRRASGPYQSCRLPPRMQSGLKVYNRLAWRRPVSGLSGVPATPARTASRSCCRRAKPSIFGARYWRRG